MNEFSHSLLVLQSLEGFHIVRCTWLAQQFRGALFHPQRPWWRKKLRKVRWLTPPLRQHQTAKRAPGWVGMHVGAFWLHLQSSRCSAPEQPYHFCSIWRLKWGLSLKIITSETICLFERCQNHSPFLAYLIRNFPQSQLAQEHHSTLLMPNFGSISIYKAVKQGTSLQDRPTCPRTD